MGDSTDQSSDDIDTPPPPVGRAATLRHHAKRGRRALPWSDGSIFLVSIVAVLLLAPLWIDPSALRELTGPPATATPTLPATPQPPPDVLPELPPIGHAPATIVVSDAFARFTGEGWGIADLGGPYTAVDQGAELAVGDGVGDMYLRSAGTERDVYLGEVAARDVDMTFSFTLDALPADGAVYLYAVLRRTSTGMAYRPKVFVTSSGALFAHSGVLRQDGEYSLGRSAVVPGVIVTPGEWVNVRAIATGSDPTIMRVRAWAAGDDEPDYWNFGAIDWIGSLQGVGSVGLASYLGVRHPGGPVHVSFDDLTVTTTDLPMADVVPAP